jgi:hypothetical protein
MDFVRVLCVSISLRYTIFSVPGSVTIGKLCYVPTVWIIGNGSADKTPSYYSAISTKSPPVISTSYTPYM